jgi:hypothetical protein
MSMGRIFFNGAQTICCLKLAIAFDTQAHLDRVSHRSSLRIELPRSNRVCCFITMNLLNYNKILNRCCTVYRMNKFVMDC